MNTGSYIAAAAALCMLCGTRGLSVETRGKQASTNAVAEDPYEEIERLAEVLVLAGKHHVGTNSFHSMVEGALGGLMRSLDPYSDFLDSDAYSDMQSDTSGKYSGIGIQIGMRDGVLTVIAPIEDSPGYRAGLMQGDRIIDIDGKDAAGMSLKNAVDMLRGPSGAKVVISVLRSGEREPRTFEVVREEISVSSIKGARILRDGVGYVRVAQFTDPTHDKLKEAISRLIGEGMDSLVLDLRDNPGGLLKSAVQVCSLFLDKGSPVVITRGREGPRGELRMETAARPAHPKLPLVVLVNGGSASASEIVAGAMQDHGRAIVVGDTTFGKGSVQTIIQLTTDPSAAVRLTTAHYRTPKDRLIQGKGIDPDIVIKLTPDEWRGVLTARARIEAAGLPGTGTAREDEPAAVDRQLERAVDLLHAIRVFNGIGMRR
ncbi:MAG: S41 family peptidase [Lentisphaerae bacterium]|nr:S41 family peptidase [Lentisphaerota bacterium]